MNRQAHGSGSMAMTLVHEVRVNDILLGRGTGPNEREGNVRFQRLLEEMGEKLQDPSKRSIISKTAAATVALQTIKEQNGSFVQKLSSQSRK